MVSNYKTSGKATSIPAGLAAGALASVFLTLVIALLLAKLVDTEKIKWENIGYGIMALVFFTSYLAAIISYSRIKRQKMMVCMLSGVVYFGFLLSVTALFFGGQYYAVGVTAALVFAGSGTAGLLEIRKNRRGKRKKVKYRSR